MKAEELTVEVKAKLTVSDETAERCLRLLEMWWNDNPDADIIKEIEKEKDGITYKLRIVRRSPESAIFKIMNEQGGNQDC